MNFELLKVRAKEQANKAKEAARNIGNLDQMAANDDYIHHSQLRTAEAKKLELDSNFPNALLQANQFSMTNQDQQNDGADFFGEEDEEIGIELKRKRKRKKDPNRFMEDLTERLAKPEEEILDPINDDFNTGIESTPSFERRRESSPFKKHPLLSSITSSIIKLPVVANTLSKLMPGGFKIQELNEEESKPMLLGPLSQRKLKEDNKNNTEEDTMKDHVVVSSSVLDAEEQAELERIRTNSTKSKGLSFVVDTMQQHPHFVFIIFTLLLGSSVYFYSRHREEIDDIS